jgi:branched-chain amino acid transport system ATP-binding protein
MEALRVEALSKSFGGVEALKDVCFSVEQGEKLAIIGPNGAGKTTLLSALNGQYSVDTGRIHFMRRDITRLPVFKRARMGIARAFQSSTLFPSMTVMENILLGIHGSRGSRLQLLRPFHTYDEYGKESEKHLRSTHLWEKRKEWVVNLSHGEQKRLEIAITLAARPQLLLLDEPSAGLTSDESSEIAAIIRRLGPSITILIVAHDMDLVFGLADTILVLHYGQVLCREKPGEIQCNAKVKEIYMGVENGSDEP